TCGPVSPPRRSLANRASWLSNTVEDRASHTERSNCGLKSPARLILAEEAEAANTRRRTSHLHPLVFTGLKAPSSSPHAIPSARRSPAYFIADFNTQAQNIVWPVGHDR